MEYITKLENVHEALKNCNLCQDTPNGDRITHFGASVREMKPYDGYLDMHIAQTGLHRQELWANGQLKQAGEWKRE